MKLHKARMRDASVEIDVRWVEDSSGAWPVTFAIDIISGHLPDVSVTVSTDTAVAMRDALELALAGTRYSNKPGAV